jgi:hypothetical protein
MNPTIRRLMLIFLGIFVVINVVVLTWQFGWAMPRDKCEKEQHRWWDSGQRVCAQPVLISDITGRTSQDKQAEAAAKAAIGRAPAPKP